MINEEKFLVLLQNLPSIIPWVNYSNIISFLCKTWAVVIYSACLTELVWRTNIIIYFLILKRFTLYIKYYKTMIFLCYWSLFVLNSSIRKYFSVLTYMLSTVFFSLFSPSLMLKKVKGITAYVVMLLIIFPLITVVIPQ